MEKPRFTLKGLMLAVSATAVALGLLSAILRNYPDTDHGSIAAFVAHALLLPACLITPGVAFGALVGHPILGAVASLAVALVIAILGSAIY